MCAHDCATGATEIAQVTLDYEDYLLEQRIRALHRQGRQDSIAWLRSSYLATASQYLDA